MIALLKTYLDVIALRRGPDAVPASWLVLAFSVALLMLAWVTQLRQAGAPLSGVAPALLAYLVALAFYAAVVVFFGYPARLLQMFSTLIACGSILAILSAASAILVGALLGTVVGNLLSLFVFLWSIPVKGHIVARTVGKHWFFGVAIAMLAFMIRFGIETAYVARQQGAAL